MKVSNGKKAAVAVGVSAVLALTPVAGPIGIALAGPDAGEAVVGSAGQTSKDVAVYVNNANYGNWTMPDQASSVTDLAKGDVPEGQEFAGTWTVAWEDGSTTPGKTLDELAGDWAGVASITAEYAPVEQGGETEEPEQPASQIDVTFKYDNTSVATVADKDGKIDAAALGLPDNYTWSWTDAQGTVHEFDSSLLAGYVFTESCTVTGTANQQPEQPVSQIDVTFKYDNTTIATTADANGRIPAGIAAELPSNYTWTWTDAQGAVHEFGSDLLAGYIFTESCTVTAIPVEQSADQIDVTFKWNGGTLATVADENGLISAAAIEQLPGDVAYWTWTDAQGTVHEFAPSLLPNYIFTESCIVNAVLNDQPADPYITVNYWDGDTLLGTGAVLNGTSDWSGIVGPTKDGYTFLGWQFEGDDAIYTDAELDNVIYAADETVTEINLYAQWQENAVDPGTDPEQPGTNPEQPGTDEEGQGGEQGGATSDEQAGTDDNATDEVTPLETAKADEGTNDMPATGDSTLPVAGGIAALAGASAIAAAAAARKRHSDR